MKKLASLIRILGPVAFLTFPLLSVSGAEPTAPLAPTDSLPSLAPEEALLPPPPSTADALDEIPPVADALELPPAPDRAEPTDSEIVSSDGAQPSSDQESLSLAQRLKIPAYQRARPNMAVSLMGARQSLGGMKSSFSGAQFDDLRSGGLQFEWQPAMLQDAGVFGIGTSIQAYAKATTPNSRFRSNFSMWSLGFQGRYQARYFREQPVVPFVGYQTEFVTYHMVTGAAGRFQTKGPIFGGEFLLNWLDQDAARQAFAAYGIARSYLVAELRALSGSDTNVSISGRSLFFGLRIEF